MCGNRLSSSEDVVCVKCLMDIPFVNFTNRLLDNEMARLFWGQFPIERAATLFYYQPKSPPYKLIHNLKYHNAPYIGIMLGKLLAERYQPYGFFEGIDSIVPMPITWRRRWQRGYNQSEVFAQGISETTGLPVLNEVIKRIKFHDSQTHKNFTERKLNVDEAFKLADADKISGKHILLVDDVLTTGATIISCAKELSKAEKVRISVMTIGLTKE